MRGISTMFQAGKQGLFAGRSALATTGHNVSNVNTEGYSRQRVEQEASHQKIGTMVYGNGVRVKGILRVNDEFLSKQIAREVKFMGQYEEKDMALAQAENVFNEINNEGMNRLVTRFFNEFRKLGNEPESGAIRSSVRESAKQLVGDFHRVSRSLRDVQKTIDARVEANVREANLLAGQIAKLNVDIKTAEIAGGESPDLRDQRDLALRKLSKILDISVATNEKYEMTISVDGVGPLVSGSHVKKIYIETGKSDAESGLPEGSYNVYLEGRIPPKITEKLTNGALGGLVESRDKIVGEAKRRIDELAYAFAKKVNEVHRQGYGINGTTGNDFFKEPMGIEHAAELMTLSDAIAKDEANIVTALEPFSPGDNRAVQLIARLQHERLLGGGMSTFDDHYNGTVADLATVHQKNRQQMEHQSHILTQLEKIRESISGVSLDEETTNLVQFQHAFDASAKVLKVADEIMEEVLNIRK